MIIQKQGEAIPGPGKQQEPAKKMPDGQGGQGDQGGKGGEPPQTQIQILNPAGTTPLLETPPATPVINPTGALPGRPF